MQIDSELLTEVNEPQTQRERAKQARRQRILQAVCDLLRETGTDDLSMKTVADRAGVSLSTVYNLFESKSDILARVFLNDHAQYSEKVVNRPATDALERIFISIDIAADSYAADPDFYRTILQSHANSGKDPQLENTLRTFRQKFWTQLVQDAVEGGHLQPNSNARVISTMLVQIGIGINADWISGVISIEDLRRECRLGFAACLLPFAAKSCEPRLREMITGLHDELSHRAS